MLTLPPELRRRIAEFDNRVDAWFDKIRGNPVADRVFYSASALGDHGLVWFLAGAVRGLRSEHDWHAAVRVGLGLGIESALVNLGVKSLFRRTRPVWVVERPFPLRRPWTSSFPSGHATSGFMAATLLADGEDDLAALYYGAAALVAASRVYVKIHHASDVVGGVAIGLALGRVGRHLFPLPVESPAS